MAKTKIPQKSNQPEVKQHPSPLAEHISAVLTHPDIPGPLYDAIGDALCDLLISARASKDTPAWVQFALDRFKEEKGQGKGGAA